jgi:F420-dependent oxidoreductase-like protein
VELKLPAPCVVVLIGPSGSGKTTWARSHFAANEVVSSDALRAMVGIDEDDMAASTVAFELLERIVAERLGRKLTTVIDTTGLDAGQRRAWVEAAHQADLPVYAILFETELESVDPINRRKTHPIPKNVLRKQFSRFAEAMEAVPGEGFDGIHSPRPARAVTAELSAPAPVEVPKAGHTFGLLVSRFDWATQDLGDQLARIAWRAEDAGFTDIWFMDHFRQIRGVGRPWEDIPEAYTALSYVAGVTTRIRLGVLVSAVTHRHPVVLGKMLATLDVLSGGRVVCGLGAAWDESEHDAYGIEFPPRADRYDILEDTLRMLPLLWGKGSPDFTGETFSARELISYPRPIQDPIPIMVGGSGEKKTLRLVARYADAANLFGDPETVRDKVKVLHEHCVRLDRDPREIVVTHLTNALVAGDPDALRARINRLRGRSTSVEDYSKRHNAGLVDDLVGLFSRYSEAGAHHSIVSLPDVAMDDSIEAFGDVIARFDRP